jgi:histidinol dehydrogenase
MKKYLFPAKEEWNKILRNHTNGHSANLHSAICEILNDIKLNGDKAVLQFINKYDNVRLTDFNVYQSDYDKAKSKIAKNLKDAIDKAKENIENFHRHQMDKSSVIENTPGVKCWQKSIPIDTIGIFVPGGDAPLISSLLMLAVPAKLAGCKEIVLCSPALRKGKIKDALLYAAEIVGVTHFYKIGGIHAIAAMAYGTQSIPKVNKIFGCNMNISTVAKHLVSSVDVAICMPEGPMELAIIADATSNPVYIAADLMSQAEHGDDTQLLVVSTSQQIIDDINDEVFKLYNKTTNRKLVQKALANGKLILLHDEDEVIDLINDYAPEHLNIITKNYNKFSDRITNAGSVFLGKYSPQSAGDYAIGTNHTLPSKGLAKAYSGVNIDSFVKKITYQELSKQGLKKLKSTIEHLATAEKMFAHKNAVNIRFEN